MKNKKECKIIQDLLPNYIEKLTNEETNQYITEHLKQCEECEQTSINMQKEIELSITKKDDREVKYIKKFSKKMKFMQIILLAIVLIFIINTGRKYILMTTLSKKAEEARKLDNYYARIYFYQGDYFTIIESYNKEGKYLSTMTTIDQNGVLNKITEFNDGNKINGYLESHEGKYAYLDIESNYLITTFISADYFYTDSLGQLLRNVIMTNVKSVTINGKCAYYFSDLKNSTMPLANGGDPGIYIDRETGLPIRAAGGTIQGSQNHQETIDTIINYYYEFGTVTDENLKEPDLSKYEIKNHNFNQE